MSRRASAFGWERGKKLHKEGPTSGIELRGHLFLRGGLGYNDFKYSTRSLISCSLRSRPKKAL
jgi:hypothetical protein